MTYFAQGDADNRTNVLETHKIYVGSIQSSNLVRETQVSALTSDKKSVATIETKLNTTEYAITDLRYDTYGNITRVTGAENANNQRAYTAESGDRIYSHYSF